jgi:hypothetical protein
VTATPRAVSTPTISSTPDRIDAVQVGKSSLAPGDSQVVVVVAPPGTALTVSVTYPNNDLVITRGSTDLNGVYRLTFIVPLKAGQGLAQVRVFTPGATRGAAFAVS